jgi:hypothetical protein
MALLSGIAAVDAPRLKQPVVSTISSLDLLDWLPGIAALVEWARGLLAYEQAGDREAPYYRTRYDLAYWPLAFRENVSSFADGGVRT